jgi:Uma2 family endonuclease
MAFFNWKSALLLKSLMPHGRAMTECPFSTADGVRAADVAWASAECMAQLGNRACFPRSPEICVEVLSPSNTEEEIKEKMTLYFDAAAKEVWICGSFGQITFFGPGLSVLNASELCPEFPPEIDLR